MSDIKKNYGLNKIVIVFYMSSWPFLRSLIVNNEHVYYSKAAEVWLTSCGCRQKNILPYPVASIRVCITPQLQSMVR